MASKKTLSPAQKAAETRRRNAQKRSNAAKKAWATRRRLSPKKTAKK